MREKLHGAKAAWVPCPGGCGDYLCVAHEQHAYDCPCPPIEVWLAQGRNPYCACASCTTTKES